MEIGVCSLNPENAAVNGLIYVNQRRIADRITPQWVVLHTRLVFAMEYG